MKVLVLGDLGGQGGYHAGDEVTTEAVVAQLSARTDLEVVAVSGDVDDTARRYGWRAVPRVGFTAATDDERDARLDAVLRAAGGESTALAWDDPAWQVIHAVAEVDAVVISGGNLTSLWPEPLYERGALAMLAARYGTHLVTTGQTVGPHLTARHGELAGRVVTGSALVGARDEETSDVIHSLGASVRRIARVVDDATYLAPDEAAALPEQPYVVATVAGHLGFFDDESVLAGIADLLDDIVKQTSATVVFVAHQGLPGMTGSDAEMHRAIAARLHRAEASFVDGATARQVVALTAGASLVVGSRHHALVFAAGAGVPFLGIATDDHSTRTLVGVADQFGLGDFVVPSSAVADGAVTSAVEELVERGAAVTAHLQRVNAVRRPEHAAWWDQVVATLTDGPSDAPPPRLAAVPRFAGGTWVPAMCAARTRSARAAARYTEIRLAYGELGDEARAAAADRDAARRSLAEVESQLDDAQDEVDRLRGALDQAHTVISDELGPVTAWLRAQPTVESLSRQVGALQAEIDRLHGTKTFRYLSLPRRVYRRLRGRR